MQLIVQNYTNKYYYTKHYAARNNVVPIFRGGITQTEDRLFKMLPKIEEMKNGKILINGLSIAGLAWILGKLDEIKDSDFLKLVSSKINNMTDSNQVETTLPYSEENSIDVIPNETEVKEEEISPENNKIQKKPSISEDELERRYKNYFIEHPERKGYLDSIKDYKDLCDNYENLIKKSLLNNGDRQQTRESLKGLEDILKRLPELTENYYDAPEEISNKRLNPSQFLQNLNTIYLDKFDDICKVFAKERSLFRQYRGGDNLNTMLRIARGELQTELIEEYLNYPNITFSEFASIKQFHMESFLSYLMDLKETYKIMQYRFNENKYGEMPNFAIQFNLGLSTQKYIEATINMFEKLHGGIKLHSDKIDGKNYDYTMENLYDELFVRMRKDSLLTPLYNFAKFINPEIMSEFNYSDDEVNSIPYGSTEYITLKRKIASAIAYLDNNPRVEEVLEVMNDNNIFHNYIDNIHSILRFICRFVINDNYNPKINFREECIKQTKNLKDALAITMRNSALIQTYKHYTGLAPCFYLAKNNPLGEDILVTLNKHGQIHTIYETIKKPESYIRSNKAKQTKENELK